MAIDLLAAIVRSSPSKAALWLPLAMGLANARSVINELSQAYADLERIRHDYANLRAAAQATIGADRDGEGDPLYYLRDELGAQADSCTRAGDAA